MSIWKDLWNQWIEQSDKPEPQTKTDPTHTQQKAKEGPPNSKQQADTEPAEHQVLVTIESCMQKLKNIDDVIYKDIQTTEGTVTLIYLNTLVDSKKLLETVVLPITNEIEHVLGEGRCHNRKYRLYEKVV